MDKPRVPYFDFLRVIATIAIVLLHVSGMVFDSSAPNDLGFWFGVGCNSATRWAVPAFIMLSGALFLNPQKEVSLKSLYGKYIVKLLIIFCTWTLLYSLLLWPSLFWIKGLPSGQIHISFVRSFPVHLWFLPMLMGVYMMYPIIRLIAKDEKVTIYFLLLWFIFTLLSYIPGIVAELAALFQVHLVIGCASYALLGYWLNSTKMRVNKKTVLLFFFSTLALMWTICSITTDYEHFFDSLAPNVILLSTSVFLLAKHMNGIICRSKFIKKAIAYVRDDLLGIYLIHIFYINLLNRPHFVGHLSVFVAIPLLTIAVFVLSLFTIKALRLIPIVRYIVGDKL